MSDCEHFFSFPTMEKPSSGHVVRNRTSSIQLISST
ncbi:hypothetical protein T03_16761 [Trichinella britovi]|uniref:Uncharacterized protein n=1 Tax=Trichinella britovi TaxID=45882 RepID=A0A0V1CIW6_TRIBR|nr:hypothetical protein T03_16761 [Trichinella britovi]KRZ90899.1 hypothetical protein T08_2238 [Trichinella sp. T8]